MKYILNKEKYLGNNFIELGNKSIALPAPIQYIETFYEDLPPEYVKIIIMFGKDNFNKTPENNVHCYNANGDCAWKIEELLNEYEKINHMSTKDTRFYHLSKLNFQLLYVYGAECHYYIHAGRGKIIYLEGHR